LITQAMCYRIVTGDLAQTVALVTKLISEID
jgi:hypothetical protein